MEKMKTTTISMAELKAEEFLQFGNDLVKVVKKSNASDLGLAGVLNLLEAAMTDANNISKEVRKHPLSGDIDALRGERDKKALTLNALIKAYKQSPAENVKAAAALAIPLLEVYLNSFTKANNFVKSQRLEMLFAKVAADNEFAAALETLGLKSLVQELRTIQTALKAKVEDRRATMPESTGGNSAKMMDHASGMMRKLLSTIDTNALVETTLDYSALITEVNATIAEFKRVIAIRRAQKKQQLLLSKQTTPAAGTTGAVNQEVA